MITDFILLVVYNTINLLLFPIQFLPDVEASSTVITAITTATSYIAVFNNFLPLGAIFTILSTILLIEIAIMVYKIIMWVIRRIPTQS